jgi:hypothetical protein
MWRSCFAEQNAEFCANVAAAISAPVTAVSVLIALFAFFLTRRQHIAALENFNQTLLATYYSELDRLYFDLIAMRMGKPHLSGDQTDIETVLQRQEYDQYAFLVWNFLETLHDRCLPDPNGKKKNQFLESTWKPVFEYEMVCHRRWFTPLRQQLFKQTFSEAIKTYLRELDAKPVTPASGIELPHPEAGTTAQGCADEAR